LRKDNWGYSIVKLFNNSFGALIRRTHHRQLVKQLSTKIKNYLIDKRMEEQWLKYVVQIYPVVIVMELRSSAMILL
jgi:hypothetical protein